MKSKALLYFTISLIFSGLLQQMYYIIDSIIVGNYLGENALAGKLGVDVIAISEVSSLVLGAVICFSRYRSNGWQSTKL